MPKKKITITYEVDIPEGTSKDIVEEVGIALLPIIILFIVYQIFVLRIPKTELIKIFVLNMIVNITVCGHRTTRHLQLIANLKKAI